MKPKFKKMFALVTAFLMSITVITPNFAKAADKPVIWVETVSDSGADVSKLERGDNFTVNVKLNTNSVQKIAVIDLSLHFDPEIFEIVDKPQTVMPANGGQIITGVNERNSTLNFAYSVNVSDSSAQVEYDGVLYTATLKVKDNAKVGNTSLDFDTSNADPMNYSDNGAVDTTLTGKNLSVVSPLKSISFNGKTNEATIDLGQTETLTVVYNPEDTTDDKTVTWKSTNPNAVTVDNGVVKAVGEGSSTVTATVGEKVATIDYSVRIPVESITINGDETLKKNEVKTLTVTYNPTNTTQRDVVWNSSNKEIVSVDSSGKITGKKGGIAKITATVGNVKAEKEVKVVVPIESVTIDGDGTILKGESKRLTAKINPEDTTDDKTVTWSSDNENVLSVDQNGQIRGIKEGTVNIKAVVGEKETTKQITVNEIHINSIAIDGDQEFKMTKNQTKELKAKIDPENTTDDKTTTWSSRNEDVATVDSNGKVKALKKGETIITAKIGSHEAFVKITVNEININSISINELDNNFKKGDKFTFTVSCNPENTTDDKTVTWSSSDEDVGKIDNDGNFVALKEGKTTLTAKVGNFKAETVVNVSEKHIEDFKLLQNEGDVLKTGNTQKLLTVISPEDFTDLYTIKYKSSDETIATVDDNGNVTALKDGKVTISAKLTTEYNDEFEDSIEINVLASEDNSNVLDNQTNNETSPKTGDLSIVFIAILMFGATITLVITKKKFVK